MQINQKKNVYLKIHTQRPNQSFVILLLMTNLYSNIILIKSFRLSYIVIDITYLKCKFFFSQIPRTTPISFLNQNCRILKIIISYSEIPREKLKNHNSKKLSVENFKMNREIKNWNVSVKNLFFCVCV